MSPETKRIIDSLDANLWSQLYRCRWCPETRAEVVPILRGFLESDDLEVCHWAMRAAARINRCNQIGALKQLIPPIVRCLEHGDPLTRQIAAGTLYGVGGDSPEIAVPALVRAADREELLVPALHALISIGEAATPAAPLFIATANHRLGKLRRLAIRGLGAISANECDAIPVLQRALQDKNARVREMAEKVLRTNWPQDVIATAPKKSAVAKSGTRKRPTRDQA